MPKITSKEANIIITIKSFKKDIYETLKATTRALGIYYIIVYYKIKRIPSYTNSTPNCKKLSLWEAKVLIKYIINIDT